MMPQSYQTIDRIESAAALSTEVPAAQQNERTASAPRTPANEPEVSEIAVAIVNYNTCRELEDCLNSITRDIPDDILVIDNASTDGSIEMLTNRFPDVRVQQNSSNPGYGAAGNQALEMSTADYVLLLNSDTIIAPGSLAALRTYMDEHPHVAVAGPRLLNPDGTLQPSCYAFPTPFQLALHSLGLTPIMARLPVLRNLSLRWWPHDRDRTVPWVLGAAILLRREHMLASGGFDESFFMYYEEVDLCYRLKAAGLEVHFTPSATVTHIGGASTDQNRGDMTVQWFRSLQHFYAKHYSAGQMRMLLLYGRTIATGRWLGATLRALRSPDDDSRVALATSQKLLRYVRRATE